MRGLLAFNDNHELLYLKADKQFRALLKKRQSEFREYSVNPSGEDHSNNRLFDGCDSITVAYIFLPLIVCYETMKCIKFDRYYSIRNSNICFHFSESNDDNRLILLAVGDGTAKKEEMEFLLSNFVSALEFTFGPLSGSMTHPSLTGQLDLLTYSLKNTSQNENVSEEEFLAPETHTDEKTFLQNIFQYVDINGLAKENLSDEEYGQKSPITAALTCIGSQFHAFLKCQLCFLVRKNSLLATFWRYANTSENADRKKLHKTGSWKNDAQIGDQYQHNVTAKAWQVITLLRTASKFGFGNYSTKRQSEPTCYYCYTIALRHGPTQDQNPTNSLPDDVFSDVFRIDLSDDVQLICITPVTHGDLISDLTSTVSMIEKLDRLRFERALLSTKSSTQPTSQKIQTYYDYWMDRLNIHARLLCDRLDDRLIFMEGSKSRKLASSFQGLYRNLHVLSSTKNRRPDVAQVGSQEGEEISTLKSLRRLASALLLDTFSAATEEAKRYKLEKLDRCWRNLNQSDFYSSTITNLMDSMPSFSIFDEAPPSSRFALDAIAYVFLLPKRRFLLSNGFQVRNRFKPSDQIFICRTMQEMITRPQLTLNLISPRRTEGKHLLVFLSIPKQEKKSLSRSLFSKLASSLSSSSSESKTPNDYEYMKNLIKEPLVIMGAYEHFVNEDLAWRETRLLAIHLYEMVMGLRWSFY